MTGVLRFISRGLIGNILEEDKEEDNAGEGGARHAGFLVRGWIFCGLVKMG